MGDQPQPLGEPIFDELFEVAEIARFSEDEQDTYQVALKAYRDFQNVVNTAIQEAEEKAEQRGQERGLKKGIEQGIEQGIEKGGEQERSRFLSQQRALILRLLSRQIDTIPDELQDHIQRLSLDDLEALANALFEFNHVDDLKRWLNQHQPKQT